MTNDHTEKSKLVSLGMYIASGTLICIFLFFTACTMHSNTYDTARSKAEALVLKEEVTIQRVKSQAATAIAEAKRDAEAKRLDAMERLVIKGINPLAARCAVEGWNKESEGAICERASQKTGN